MTCLGWSHSCHTLALALEDGCISLHDAAGKQTGLVQHEGNLAALAWRPSRHVPFDMVRLASVCELAAVQITRSDCCIGVCSNEEHDRLAAGGSHESGGYLATYAASSMRAIRDVALSSPLATLAYHPSGARDDQQQRIHPLGFSSPSDLTPALQATTCVWAMRMER